MCSATFLSPVLEKTGDFAGAHDALEASLQVTPGQFPVLVLLGEVYLGLEDAEAAEDQFEAALLLQPKSLQARLGVARAQIVEGNFADPRPLLESLSKSHPENAEIFELLARLYNGMGKKRERG